MPKSTTTSKRARSDEDFDADTKDANGKSRQTKTVVFGIWFLIVFGLMAAFILTTNQNYNDTPGGGGPANQAQGEVEGRIKSLQAQLADKPEDPQLMVQLGFALIEANRFEDAIVSFQRTLSFQPDQVDALVGMGIAYQFMSKPTEALAQYDKALQVDPNSEFAKIRKGYLLASMPDRREEALKLLREVEAKQPIGSLKTQLKSIIADIEKPHAGE